MSGWCLAHVRHEGKKQYIQLSCSSFQPLRGDCSAVPNSAMGCAHQLTISRQQHWLHVLFSFWTLFHPLFKESYLMTEWKACILLNTQVTVGSYWLLFWKVKTPLSRRGDDLKGEWNLGLPALAEEKTDGYWKDFFLEIAKDASDMMVMSTD